MNILHIVEGRNVNHRSLQVKVRNIVFDIIIVLVTYLLAVGIRTALIDLNLETLTVISVSASSMPILLYLFGVYNRVWTRGAYGVELIAYAVGTHTLLFTLADFVSPDNPVPLTVVFVGNLLALSGFILIRFSPNIISQFVYYRMLIQQGTTASDNIVRVMIVGAGEAGQILYDHLRTASTYRNKYFILGYVDDDPQKQGLYIQNRPVLGRSEDIPRLAEKHDIQLIIIAIANISGQNFRKILSACQKTNARINIIPGLSEYMDNAAHSPLLRELSPEDLIGRSPIERHEAVDFTPILNKVILITGACGSIGSVLCRQIIAFEPKHLILLDINESGLYDLQLELSAKHPHLLMTTVLGDITDYKGLKSVFAEHRPQVIFHAAAFKHVPILERFPNQAVGNNIAGTKNLKELASQYQVERFVLISTDKAVKPSNVMGASKRICELLLLAYPQKQTTSVLFTSVRFGNVLGSRGSVVPVFEKQIKMGGPVTITDPAMSRYFLSIPEAVNLVIHAACLTQGGDTFLLQMGDEVSITELAHRIIRMYGLRPDKDIPIVYTGARPGEKLNEELYDNTSEIALPTIHPGIIRLHNPHLETWDAALFLHLVEELLETGIVNKAKALEELLKPIEAAMANPLAKIAV